MGIIDPEKFLQGLKNPFANKDIENMRLIAIHETNDEESPLRNKVFLVLEERFDAVVYGWDHYHGIACYYEDNKLKTLFFRREVSLERDHAQYDAYEIDFFWDLINYFNLEKD